MTTGAHGFPLRLDGILRHAAASAPERTAVVFGDLAWTYAEVADRAHRLATVLASLGVGEGDRVALWACNCPEFVEILFGAPLIGAIAAPLDHWWEEKAVLAALVQVRPKVIVAGPQQARHLARLGSGLRSRGVESVLSLGGAGDGDCLSYSDLLASAPALREPAAASEEDAALILFTSGSTGLPKGAVHTHRSLCSTAMIMNLELGLRDGETSLHFLPLFSSCLEQMIPLTLVGATHVILPQFGPARAWEAIGERKITHVNAVPTTLRRLLDHIPASVPESLRLVSFASEPMPPQLLAELTGRLPRAEFVEFYGMIEQLCLTVQSSERKLGSGGSVGRPMIGAELRVAGDGEAPGEILARTPSLFAGYWEDPAATAQVIEDGWMRTGDIGRFDEDGHLILCGRIKEIIKSGGVTIVPSEVEATILMHEFVLEAAVVGIPDEAWGEAVHAFVVLTPDAQVEESELVAFCRNQLAGYKTPKAVHFVDDLPRTGIGKVARRHLRERFLRQSTSGVAA